MSNLAYYHHAREYPSIPIEQGSSNDAQEALKCYPALAPSYMPYQTDGSGVIRVPCKARGIKNEHNARTAFVEIPANPTHGLILVCSHADCFNSGRRFRYCAICHTPVAKRNFNLRHGHGLNLLRAASTNADVAADCVPSAPFQRHEKRRSRCVSPDAHEMASIAKQARQELGEELDEEELADAGIERPKKMVKQVSSAVNVKLTPEETDWLSLLHDRPDSEDIYASTKWLESLVTWAMPQESDSLPNNSTEFDSLISGREDILSACDDGEELNDAEEDFVFDFDMI